MGLFLNTGGHRGDGQDEEAGVETIFCMSDALRRATVSLTPD